MKTKEFSREQSRVRLAREIYDIEAIKQRAWELIDTRGEINHDHWEMEPEINARTALFEALTSKGHLSCVEFDEPIEQANQRTLQRLLNGWSDSYPQWEKDRRYLEIVEELVIHDASEGISRGILPADTLVITISNIPKDRCGDEKSVSEMGYGVLNDKGMVRGTSFENGMRKVEQVSRSNSNDGSAESFLNSHGYVVGNGSDIVLGNQIIATRKEFPNGVVDVQRALDTSAGPNIIYGEYCFQKDLNVPKYEDLREVSAAREEQAENFVKKLADFERAVNIKYDSGEINYDQKLGAIHTRRKELVAEICLLEPGYTKDAMGEEAVRHIEEAALAMAAGNHSDGSAHFSEALAASDPRAGAVCGGIGSEAQSQNPNSSKSSQLYREALSERKNWKWKRGICIVKECPTRPDKTQVGPCSVCGNCQRIFDKGDNPKTVYRTLGFLDMIFKAFQEDRSKNKNENKTKAA